MKCAFLLLGSNAGAREIFLDNARMRIRVLAGQLQAASPTYETAAWGKNDQPPFLNQVLEISTMLEPTLLLTTLLAIENSLGRIRTEKWAPRTIDIDILLYNDLVINLPHLVIPHPSIPERRFALTPLADVAPDFVHPVLKKTMSQLLLECADPLTVVKC